MLHSYRGMNVWEFTDYLEGLAHDFRESNMDSTADDYEAAARCIDDLMDRIFNLADEVLKAKRECGK